MRWAMAATAVVAMAGCQSQSIPPVNKPTMAAPVVLGHPIDDPTTRPAVTGVVSLTGDIRHPGPRELYGTPKISDLLCKESLSASPTKLCVTLVRRCPEGTTSEVIDLRPDLTVLDSLRNYDLRDGDQLIVSVSGDSAQQTIQPLLSEMPPAH